MYTPDLSPVLGPVAGIALAGGVARLVAEMIDERAPFVDPTPFAPAFLQRCADARSRKTVG